MVAVALATQRPRSAARPAAKAKLAATPARTATLLLLRSAARNATFSAVERRYCRIERGRVEGVVGPRDERVVKCGERRDGKQSITRVAFRRRRFWTGSTHLLVVPRGTTDAFPAAL